MFCALAAGPSNVGVSPDTSSSDLAPWAYRSFPETDYGPPQRVLLGELLRIRHYRSDPDNPSCVARIEQLRASTSAYEEEEDVPNRPSTQIMYAER